MAKKTYTTQSVKTYALLNRLERQLTDLFGSTYEGALKIAAVRKAIAAGESFTFDENRPETKQLIKSLSVMAGKADRLLADSVTLAWQEGEESVTNACYSAFGSIKGSKEAVRAIADRSREDLRKRGVSASAFYNRQHGGLTISDRVWNIAQSGKSEIEEIIQQGVLQGKSAAEISRSVRSYLRNPNKLFRRVRNKETGELELSKNARNYHPGRGVYRSSCQNAMRLARTEVNAAYRRAEWESYQNNPLITGYRIQLSNNHTIKIKGKAVAFHDICDELAGDYPKTFQWTGWHPQCRCRMIPIFLTEGDFRARIRALAAGKLDTWKAGNTVTQLPEAFTGWVKANTDRIKSAKQVPFFILDNYKGGDPTKGLVDTITSLKQQVKESAKVQPVTEYDGELADLEKWSATFELDTTQARILREAGDKAGLKKEIERLQDLKDNRSTEWLTARTRLRIFADKLKEYPEYTKYDNILQQYEIKPQGPTWKEAVQKLKDAANQARADFDKRLKEKEAEKQRAQAAEEIKNAPAKSVKPKEINETWLKEGDKDISDDFWKLVDPKKPVPLKFNDKGGAYYSPSEKAVHFVKGKRAEASRWYRSGLICHEFGHAIDDQRKLFEEKEVIAIRKAQRKRLLEQVTYLAEYKEIEWVGDTYKFKKTYKEVTIAKADALCRQMDALQERISRMTPETFSRFFPGMTKADYNEMICATQDTIKSLVVKYGYGHSSTYFGYKGMKEKEWLAHAFENAFMGNSVFKHYMPEEYKEMVAYIESLNKY